MNVFYTRALAAIFINAASVRGGCLVQPDADGVVKIPALWTYVPANAFYMCTALKKVEIPKNIRAIFSQAFYNSGLRKVSFEANGQLETIGNAASYFPLRSCSYSTHYK
mmetsp:Transcript_19533/g.38822  ORF Transcript_19533/g.38822 Transcript_19533/m.38822 type:complete len:109 (-) Transcript_19533:610-936(-)